MATNMARSILLCNRFATKILPLNACRKTLNSAKLSERHFYYLRHCNGYNNIFDHGLNKRYLSEDTSVETGEKLTITISENCVKQLKKITSDDKDKSILRVMVEGGGCSGFQYTFNLDTKQEPDDIVFEKEGVKVVVDETSLEILNGSTIDYHEELIRSAFRVIDNPKAEMGCSCGVSFSLKV